MAMNSWEVSDAFWSKVEPLIPRAKRDSNGSISVVAERDANRWKRVECLRVSCMFCEREYNGRRFPENMGVQAAYIVIFSAGRKPDCFKNCGRKVWRNTMSWKGFPGVGKVSTEQ